MPALARALSHRVVNIRVGRTEEQTVVVVSVSPSGIEVSKGVGDVAGHADHHGPLTAQVLDHDGGQEHGGDDDGGVDDTQRRHAHPLLRVQTALDRRDANVMDETVAVYLL